MSDDTAQAAGEGMSEERIEHIRSYLLPPGVGGMASEFARKLLAEVERLRDLNAELSETLDVRHDETQQLRARLAEIGETREAIATAIENLPEPEPPSGSAVPAWYGGYEDGLDAAARVVRGKWREVPDA